MLVLFYLFVKKNNLSTENKTNNWFIIYYKYINVATARIAYGAMP